MKKNSVIILILLALITTLCFSVHATEQSVDVPTDQTASSSSPERPADDLAATQILADWLQEHTSDIISSVTGMAFIAFVFAFRKKLVPAVTNAILQIAQKSEGSEKKFSEGVSSAVNTLERCGDFLEVCAKKIDKTADDMLEREKARSKAYELQTELINYLIVNLRIPSDLRAGVIERAAAVKKALEETEKGE